MLTQGKLTEILKRRTKCRLHRKPLNEYNKDQMMCTGVMLELEKGGQSESNVGPTPVTRQTQFGKGIFRRMAQ
jgi:hypothetical protein